MFVLQNAYLCKTQQNLITMSELFNYLSNNLEVTLGIVLLIVFVISIIKARGGKLTFFPAWLFPLLISTTIFLQVYKVVHFIF